MRNDKSERLDGHKLGTREKTPRLAIVRRGDQVYFMLNSQAGLQKTIKSLPKTFRVMLYGFGSSENNWILSSSKRSSSSATSAGFRNRDISKDSG